jgi:hypothetical protein
MVIPENYRKVLTRFIKKNGNKPVVLFAVLKMDELVDKWSVLVSADWIEGENNRQAFSDLIEILQDELDSDELNEIARIVIYNRSQHLVELMLKQFKEGQHIEEDAKVNGNVIHEGYIISLNNVEPGQESLAL